MINARVVVVGQGKFAQLLKKELPAHIASVVQLCGDSIPNEVALDFYFDPVVAVHVGSGRLFPDLVRWCTGKRIPIVQASSKAMEIPADLQVPIINAPNLALAMVAYLRSVSGFGGMIKQIDGYRVRVTESHQSTKTSPPITAQNIAKSFGLPPESVISVRDQVCQRNLGVPEEHLDGHAYHMVFVDAGGVEISTKIKIHGRLPYALGLVALVGKIVSLGDTLSPGIHELDNLMFDYGLIQTC